MPTVDERLAILEMIAKDNRDRIDEIADMIKGGGDVAYDQSIRGRQHNMAGELKAMNLRAKYLAEHQQQRRVILSGWQQALVVFCAVATVAASWYGVLIH